MQNQMRPIPEVVANLEKALEVVRKVNYEGLKQFKSEPLDVIGSCLRSVFRASPGKKLLICDLSSIENRVLGYICKAPSILKVFTDGLDPYKYFGADLFKKPYDQITKEERQISKPAVLGCGYRLSGGEETVSKDGDKIFTGLMGYARAMGIEITKELADLSVQVFRDKHWEVVQNWYDLENASLRCVNSRQTQNVNDIVEFEMVDDVMRMNLPSGRSLHYLQPKIVEIEFFGKMKKALEYWGINQKLHQWGRITTHGGKLLENADQAISRDILVHALKLAESRGLPVVMHCHDELVCEVDKNSGLTINDLRDCMIQKPSWANEQLIIDASGFESEVYRKD